METHLTSQTRKTAEDLFASGLYCAKSVVVALAKAQGIESDLLPRMATAFCGGMARTCGTPEGQATFRESKLHVRCANFTGRAAEIAANIIAESGG